MQRLFPRYWVPPSMSGAPLAYGRSPSLSRSSCLPGKAPPPSPWHRPAEVGRGPGANAQVSLTNLPPKPLETPVAEPATWGSRETLEE